MPAVVRRGSRVE